MTDAPRTLALTLLGVALILAVGYNFLDDWADVQRSLAGLTTEYPAVS